MVNELEFYFQMENLSLPTFPFALVCELNEEPLGAASVKQVRSTVLTEKYGDLKEVAIKIQLPSIELKLVGNIAN